MFLAVLYGTLAGVVGTGLGALFGITMTNSKFNKAAMLFFSGGFMFSMVVFELLKEALTLGGLVNVVASMLFGVLFVVVVSSLVESKVIKHQNLLLVTGDSRQKFKMFISGLVILIAIAVHNFPEGLAIGSGQSANIGLTLGILIAVHNMPEGAAMALPLKEYGVKNSTILWYAMLSGMPTALGALFGNLLGNVSGSLVASSLALAAGAMAYITAAEILPQAFSHKAKGAAWFLLVGAAIGLFLVVVL